MPRYATSKYIRITNLPNINEPDQLLSSSLEEIIDKYPGITWTEVRRTPSLDSICLTFHITAESPDDAADTSQQAYLEAIEKLGQKQRDFELTRSSLTFA